MLRYSLNERLANSYSQPDLTSQIQQSVNKPSEPAKTNPRAGNSLMTVEELGMLLNCKPSYVYRLVHERRIPYIKLGHRQLRFDPREINRWLESKKVKSS